MKKLVIPFLLILLSACTYYSGPEGPVSPVTYATPVQRNTDSIGILRRMAIMPIDFDPLEKQAMSQAGLDDIAMDCERKSAAYLRHTKGYGILLARNSASRWQRVMHLEDGGRSLGEVYAGWCDASHADRTRSMVRQIGRAMNVDGVIVIRIKERRLWNAFDGMINIALMNLPMVYQMSTPNISVSIFETATGSKVWETEQSTFGDLQVSYPKTIIGLFSDIENAVPPQLVE